MIRDLLDSLASEWAPTRLQKPLEAIKLAGSSGLSRNVNFMVFEKGSKFPTYLLRISRDKAYQSGLESEYQNLKYLSSLEGSRASVPAPIGLFSHDGRLVLVETCLRGISLENLIMRRRYARSGKIRKELNLVQDWLVSFWRETQSGGQQATGNDTLEKGFSAVGDTLTPNLRNDLLRGVESVGKYRLPVVASHGDFWPGNIVVDGNRIGVIDWETLALGKSPLRDLFFFVTMYGMRQFSGTYINKFSSAFLSENRVSIELSNMVRSTLKRLEVPPELSGLLFVTFLLEMASSAPVLQRSNQKHSIWSSYFQEISSLQDLVL